MEKGGRTESRIPRPVRAGPHHHARPRERLVLLTVASSSASRRARSATGSARQHQHRQRDPAMARLQLGVEVPARQDEALESLSARTLADRTELSSSDISPKKESAPSSTNLVLVGLPGRAQPRRGPSR